MQHNDQDIVIVGGGIGGSGLASLLAAGGLNVTVLERTHTFPDRVRGEIYVPWGVNIARQLGLLQPLLDAGAHFATNWVLYDDAFPAEVAEQMGVDASVLIEGVEGMLNFTHPQACQALFDFAAAKGATTIRGVEDVVLEVPSSQPYIRWTEADGSVHESSPALIVGADGRNSVVRRAAGIELHSAPVRQHITGGLIEAPRELATRINGHGSSDDLNWYAFPQGPTRLRVYLAHFDVHRYAGAEGTARFLSDLARIPQPDVACLADGHAVTPVATYPSVDTWTDEPFADGVLLIGDSAGYNDPIIGQGLSLTMADVRDVSKLLLDGARKPSEFVDYGIARNDRLAKLRCASQTMAEMMCNFGPEAAARRLRGLPMMGTDEVVGALAAAMFVGPEALPPGTELVQAARQKLLAA